MTNCKQKKLTPILQAEYCRIGNMTKQLMNELAAQMVLYREWSKKL